MTHQTLALARWSALDREGEDTCRLSKCDHGWVLVGHARFRDTAGFAALDYILRCDEAWHTLSADIGGLHAEKDVRLHITRERSGWVLNGQPQRGLDAARDIDLSFTPATNLMPLRRMASAPDMPLQVQAAWLDYPDQTLRALDQIYAPGTTPGQIVYRASQTGYETTLTVDASGFVTLYPDLWEGEVDHAPG